MKISYQSIKEILTPKEMKNVTGGSEYCYLRCYQGSEAFIVNACPSSKEDLDTACPDGWNYASCAC